jgi:hypothetical protein
MLSAAEAIARTHGWAVISRTANPGFLAGISDDMLRLVGELGGGPPTRIITAFSAAGLGLTTQLPQERTADWRRIGNELLRLLDAKGQASLSPSTPWRTIPCDEGETGKGSRARGVKVRVLHNCVHIQRWIPGVLPHEFPDRQDAGRPEVGVVTRWIEQRAEQGHHASPDNRLEVILPDPCPGAACTQWTFQSASLHELDELPLFGRIGSP